LLCETVEDELVVYDTATHMAHALSAEAASVWERCDGTRSCVQIARELGVEDEFVQRAVTELERCGLLEQPRHAPPRFSRREAGVKLGKAALLGPLIYSAAIPAPSAAASPATCAVGVVEATNTTCLNVNQVGNTGPLTTPGNLGKSTHCPLIGGNAFNPNCYVTLNNGVVCTSTNCVLGGSQGCDPTGVGSHCCAGTPCCVPDPAHPGSFHCAQ
jgi:hypothetical protein